jgi:conjugative relaxase-like TrwC/TraI family protein
MFTAIAHKNVEAAKGYFSEHLSQNDYYAAAEVKPGLWIGVGAERLGLHDLVTREAFDRLCSNQHPDTSDRLTQRQGAENTRRIFYDFTCSAPKSVSILAVTIQDERLVEAHADSARAAFRELEAFAATRIRKTSAQDDRRTSNLVAAEFLHTSSRALDPQLHTHFTVFNATHDTQEKAWKALQAGPMYEALRYATAVYRNELARKIEEAGYKLRLATHGFEIEGVSHALIQRFSKRAQQRDAIVTAMENRLGRKLSNDEISFAVHRSRSRKLRGISSQEVRLQQAQQLSTMEKQELEALRQPAPAIPDRRAHEQRSIDYALAHVFERHSVVPEQELLQVALTHRLGGNSLPLLKRALQETPGLIRTTKGLTTQQIMETELKVIERRNEAVKIRRSDGSELCLDLQNFASFDVGNVRPLPIATGERLLLQANATPKLINGEIVTVSKVAEDGVHLIDGRIIPPDYQTFTHGYAITSHAAQGKVSASYYS